jgi:hypothetical protein
MISPNRESRSRQAWRFEQRLGNDAMSAPPHPLKLPFEDSFFGFDVEVARRPGLSDEAKAVYAALGAYVGPELVGFELLEYLTQDTGMSLIAVARHLTELKRAALLR